MYKTAVPIMLSTFPDKDPENLRRDPGGKPYWEGCHFNLSHSGPWVALAVGEERVGVDVECFRESRNVEALAKRYFTPEEQAFVGSSQGRFLEIWTAKEARLKWEGTGLRTKLDGFSVREDPMGKTWHLPGAVLTLWAGGHPEDWEPVEICKIVPPLLEFASLQAM